MDFHFPFEPYDIQNQFMSEMYKTIESKKIGIFESPTGTVRILKWKGKSLSLVCSALTWLENNKNIDLEENLENEPLWVQEFRKKQKIQEKESKLKRKNELVVRADKVSNKIERSSDDILLDDYESDEEMGTEALSRLLDEDIEEEIEVRTRIIFCSRTHSQLSQTLKELGKTFFKDKIKAIPLSSRKQLCINEKIKKYTGDKLNEKCKDAVKESKCVYMKKNEPTFFHPLRLMTTGKIVDLEDIAKLGNRFKRCPYYGTREIMTDSDFIAIPYNLLLQKSSREAIGLDLRDSIIIVDEAHNLIDQINQIHSVEISSKQIDFCHFQLSAYFEKFKNRLKGKNVVYIKQLLHILLHLSSFSKKNNSNLLQVNDFLLETKIDHYNMFKIQKYFRESKVMHKVGNYSESIQENEDLSLTAFHTFESFIMSLANSDASGRIICLDFSLKYVSLNPFFAFQEIVEQSRSIILAGGTMHPVMFTHSRLKTTKCNYFPISVRKTLFHFNVDILSQEIICMYPLYRLGRLVLSLSLPTRHCLTFQWYFLMILD